ncbi:DUF1190 domain-containing protein [Gemmobacter denitrificans]|uniref:DUF1190 domain-containing protein n=1 Tax=Gemmobacter denitrificans TaxID=3123040 RepID=A0ABU8BY23_9RHOB
MKRSRLVPLALLGAAAFGLSACQEEATDAASFDTLDSCLAAAKADGWFTEADCRDSFTTAQALHDETAPRYASKDICEEQHGQGACGTDSVSGSSGGGSIFMPLLMGYLIGSALGGGRPVAQPLMGRAGGGFATPGGTAIGNLNGAGKMPVQAFAKAPTTKGLPPMTRAAVAERGGFGKSATRPSSGG